MNAFQEIEWKNVKNGEHVYILRHDGENLFTKGPCMVYDKRLKQLSINGEIVIVHDKILTKRNLK